MKIRVPKKKIYPNGATLIYIKRKLKCTSVMAGIAYGENRKNYPEPTAHFCEHMFFIETNNRPKEKLKQDIIDVFSRYNGSTNIFRTNINFCRSNKVLEPCFELSSDMLLNTKFSSKYVESEKGVINQELVRQLNNPDIAHHFNCLRTYTSTKIENSSVLGNAEEINAITPKILKKFRDETFISQNFIIAVEGGISYRKAKRLAEKYYINKLKSNPNYKVDRTVSDPWDKSGNLNIEYFQMTKAICTITIKLDEDLRVPKNENYANMLTRLCNGVKGKLLGGLRNKGLVYEAYLSYDDTPDSHSLKIRFTCSNDCVNKVIDEIGKLFEEFKTIKIEQKIIDKLIEKAKIAKDEFIRQIYPTNLFNRYLYYGDDIFNKKRIKESKKSFENIKSEDLQEFCKTVLSNPEKIYVSILTNETADKFYTYEKMQKILTSKRKPSKRNKKYALI